MFVRSLTAGLVVVAMTTAAAPHGPPPKPSPPFSSGLQTKNMTIDTDMTDSNIKTGDFTMPHHVKFTRPGTVVVGDSAHGNSNQDHVFIVGHVVLHDSGNAPEGQAAGAPSGGGPSVLTCDQLEIDSKNRIYTASGNVTFTQDARHATADYGRLDQGAHLLELRGHVHLVNGESTFTGDYIRYDTLTKDVHSEGTPMQMTVPITMPAPGKAPPPKPSPKTH